MNDDRRSRARAIGEILDDIVRRIDQLRDEEIAALFASAPGARQGSQGDGSQSAIDALDDIMSHLTNAASELQSIEKEKRK